jgi:hypothetical protein
MLLTVTLALTNPLTKDFSVSESVTEFKKFQSLLHNNHGMLDMVGIATMWCSHVQYIILPSRLAGVSGGEGCVS